MPTHGKDLIFDYTDAECIRSLGDFVPDRMFDAHTHLYHRSFITDIYDRESVFSKIPYEEVSYPEFLSMYTEIFSHVNEFKALCLPMPDRSQADTSNGLRTDYAVWIAQQARKYTGKMVGSVMVMPKDTEEDIYGLIKGNQGIVGLKCYQWFAPQQEMAGMDDFLPESAWRVAEKEGLAIIVHLARPAAVADAENLQQIMEKTERYRNARLILAHCGSSFAARYIGDVIGSLRERENIFFDMAAICEPAAMFETIKGVGTARVLWGTDFPISLSKGRCVSLGSGFLWMTEKDLKGKVGSQVTCGMALYVVEQLMAFYLTARMLGLTKSECDMIFYGNAASLFK